MAKLQNEEPYKVVSLLGYNAVQSVIRNLKSYSSLIISILR
jgi:hypothetical protein